MLNLLTKLVAINSVYPDEKNLSNFIEKYLDALGFNIEKVFTNTTRPNLVATFGKSKKYLAFYGHLDTVPPDEKYSFDPYKIKIVKNHAYGLGVIDMKGGLTVLLKLAEYIVKNKLAAKLIFGVDEENISQGAHDLVDSNLLKDIGFMIVAESGQIKNQNQPLSVCFGRKGRIVFNIIVKGKKTHAAESHKGINALEKASILINEIKKIQFPTDKYFGTTDIIFQKISSESDSFSVPDTCLIQFSTLTNSKTKTKDILNKVIQLSRKLDIIVSIELHKRNTPYGESYVINLENKFLKKIQKVIINPNNILPIYTESVADENIFANRLKIPVLTLGAIGGGDHTKNEWVKLPSLDFLLSAYKTIVKMHHNNVKY